MRYASLKNLFEIKGDITEIYITNKKGQKFTVLIDTEDFDKIKKHSWSATEKKKNSGVFYVRCGAGPEGKYLSIHKCILNYPSSLMCDHINRNPLDNRKSNLRLCTNQQNSFNKPPSVKNKTGVTGVHFSKQTNKWTVQMRINGKAKHYGLFSNFEEAVKRRKELEEEHHGEFKYTSQEI